MQENTKPKMLLEVVREVIRLRHLSYKTEKHYLNWIRRFVRFHGRRHPAQMGEDEIAAYLSPSNRPKLLAINTESSAQRLGVSTGKPINFSIVSAIYSPINTLLTALVFV